MPLLLKSQSVPQYVQETVRFLSPVHKYHNCCDKPYSPQCRPRNLQKQRLSHSLHLRKYIYSIKPVTYHVPTKVPHFTAEDPTKLQRRTILQQDKVTVLTKSQLITNYQQTVGVLNNTVRNNRLQETTDKAKMQEFLQNLETGQLTDRIAREVHGITQRVDHAVGVAFSDDEIKIIPQIVEEGQKTQTTRRQVRKRYQNIPKIVVDLGSYNDMVEKKRQQQFEFDQKQLARQKTKSIENLPERQDDEPILIQNEELDIQVVEEDIIDIPLDIPLDDSRQESVKQSKKQSRNKVRNSGPSEIFQFKHITDNTAINQDDIDEAQAAALDINYSLQQIDVEPQFDEEEVNHPLEEIKDDVADIQDFNNHLDTKQTQGAAKSKRKSKRNDTVPQDSDIQNSTVLQNENVSSSKERKSRHQNEKQAIVQSSDHLVNQSNEQLQPPEQPEIQDQLIPSEQVAQETKAVNKKQKKATKQSDTQFEQNASEVELKGAVDIQENYMLEENKHKIDNTQSVTTEQQEPNEQNPLDEPNLVDSNAALVPEQEGHSEKVKTKKQKKPNSPEHQAATQPENQVDTQQNEVAAKGKKKRQKPVVEETQ